MSISVFGRLLGLAELLTAALLALKPWFPKASILWPTRLAVLLEHRWLYRIVRQRTVLDKDIALLGLSLWLLTDATDAAR
jgi:hypothetical protein